MHNATRSTAPILSGFTPSQHRIERTGLGYARPLTDAEIMRAAPAIYAEAAHVGLTYLRDALSEFDDAEGLTAAANAINDPRIAPTVRELSARGEVFVGMCSCWEFIVL
jgi:hypothetical protein